MKQTLKLDALFEEINVVVLQRQNPITGLLPASTSVNNHGDYTDAWVRDNVYSIVCVWALGVAYRKNNGSEAKADQLEQATIKLMRGLLQSMMRQASKVERFKNTLNRFDALHAKYNTTTGLEVVGDHDWGHLQIDATSLFLLMLAQMSASGLRIIKTLGEVDFVQNLLYYIGSAYRIADFGIWERGNKINNGNPEINASSVGMAKAALHALQGFNLFGKDADPRAVIHSVPDSISLARGALASLLPRESLSKEVDAALLSVIGFPAFAVGDPSLVEKTKQEILSKLAGNYGCKRFLLDGHQTAAEENSRIHYERTELANFEHIESEWPLFYTYLYLHALFEDDQGSAKAYRQRLEKLTVDVDGYGMLPELYYLPEENIAAEKRQPQSQTRVPNENIPLVWAQSLFLTGRMLDDGLLMPEHIDILKLRQRTSSSNESHMALVILAENEHVKASLTTHGVIAETLDDIAPCHAISAPHLVDAYTLVGANEALGLTGRPRRRLQSLATSQTYKINGQEFLCLSWLQSDPLDYRTMDPALLSIQLNREIIQILNNWTKKEVAVFTLMINESLCKTPNITLLFDALKRLQLRTEHNHVGYASASLAFRASSVSELTIPNLCLSPITPKGDDALTSTNKDELPIELRQLFATWTVASKQRDNQQQLAAYLKGKSLAAAAGESTQNMTVKDSLNTLYAQAKTSHCWLLARYCYSRLGHIQMELADGITLLVARNLSVVIDESQQHILNKPVENAEVAELINRSTTDYLERALLQELLVHIGTLIRTEPEIFYGIRTMQLDNLLKLCCYGKNTDEAKWQQLAELSPSELFNQIHGILVVQRERFKEGLDITTIIRSEGKKTLRNSSAVKAHAVDTDWFEWRAARGSITRFGNEFLQAIWLSLENANTIVFVDLGSADTVLDCAVVRSSTTAGEETFAQIIDAFAQQLHPAYYRAAIIEVLYGYTEFCSQHSGVMFDEPLILSEILEKTAKLFAKNHVATSQEPNPVYTLMNQSPSVLQKYVKPIFLERCAMPAKDMPPKEKASKKDADEL